MRRIVLAALSTLTAVVLLFSYHTSTNTALVATGAVQQVPTQPTPTATPSPSRSTGSGAAQPPTAPGGGAASTKSAAPVDYTGGVVDTEWGPVQVKVKVSGGRITNSTAVQYPQGTRRDAEINSVALPILAQEVVQQQSARIDTVSGATVTSGGYQQSLQSALDQAHL